MNLQLKANKEMVAPSVYMARLLKIVDLGTQSDGKFGPARKLRFSFELEALMSDGRPFVIDKTYTASLSPKSNLFKDIKAFASQLLSIAELTGEPLKVGELLGVLCMIQVDTGKSATGSDYNKIVAIMGAPKGATIPASPNASYYLSLEPGEYDKVLFQSQPDFIKQIIEASPEFKKLV